MGTVSTVALLGVTALLAVAAALLGRAAVRLAGIDAVDRCAEALARRTASLAVPAGELADLRRHARRLADRLDPQAATAADGSTRHEGGDPPGRPLG